MSFPIESSLVQIKKALAANKDLILTAQPGAGKSTIVPLSLKEELWLENKKILMLQPRRVAAVSIARRMAEIDNTEPGKVIGHSVRFNSNIRPSTKIQVLTDGILTKRLQKDPFLEDVALVIFDEFHERSLDSDFCLALCKEIKKEVRPDLRIMIMSATIDTEAISNFLNNPEKVSGKGFLYPVDISYMPIGFGKEYFLNLAKTLERIILDSKADEEYLVFLPGIGEINLVKDYLCSRNLSGTRLILCLHGSMGIDEQKLTLKKVEKPRIILTTNIAETSLTIEGITTVVDSGYARQASFNWQTGLNKLELKRISKASAIQRAGRAGRLRAGRAIRLYSKAELDSFPENEVPEILRSDPTSTILELFAWGISQPDKFNWFEPPSRESLSYAVNLLNMLGAVDEKGRITDFGKRLCDTPLEPRLACMLIKASHYGLVDIAAKAAAIISEKDFLETTDPDLRLRLEAFDNQNFNRHKLDESALRRAKQVAEDLKKQVKNTPNPASGKAAISYLLLQAFPDRVCQKRGAEKSGNYTLSSGQGLSIDSESLLKDKGYILSLKQDSSLRASGNGKIFLACELEADWLIHSQTAKKNREVYFSKESKKICAKEQVKYGNLILSQQQTNLKEEDYEEALKSFLEAVTQDLEAALDLNEKGKKSFAARLRLIQSTSFGKNYPIIDQVWLKRNILPLASIKDFSFDWLKKLPISEIYFSNLNWKLKEDFEKLVPERFKLPTGSSVKIDYASGHKPILPVKMQEMFGQASSPSICGGEVPLVVHLLSPANRPMQITSDLASFWKDGYKAVVGELRGRYPKHSWPEDPSVAKPTKR